MLKQNADLGVGGTPKSEAKITSIASCDAKNDGHSTEGKGPVLSLSTSMWDLIEGSALVANWGHR